MDNKRIYKIINETINEFDFLKMDEMKEEEDFATLVNSKDFQVKLINDLATWNKQKIIDWKPDISYSNLDDIDIDDGDRLNFEYGADFNYIYDNKKIPLSIYVEGEDVPYRTSGSYRPATHLDPPEYAEIDTVDYEYSDITLFTGDGEEIDISWLESNPKLYSKVAANIVDI